MIKSEVIKKNIYVRHLGNQPKYCNCKWMFNICYAGLVSNGLININKTRYILEIIN